MKFSKEKVQQFKTDFKNIFPDGSMIIAADRTDGVYAFKMVVQKVNTVQIMSLSELVKNEGCGVDLKRSGTGICVMIS